MAISGRELLQKEHASMPDSIQYIADTTTYTGRWSAILIPSSSPAVFTTLTMQDGTDLVTASTHIPRDMYFQGYFSEIKLSSGAVFAVKS